jgi:hypothetical protein
VGPGPSRSLREYNASQSFPHLRGALWVPVLSARLQEQCGSLSFPLFKEHKASRSSQYSRGAL